MRELPQDPNVAPALRAYQREGIKFLVGKRRAILADEQGLGKCAQALLAARELDPRKLLIIAPGNAHGVWLDEIALWTPELAERITIVTYASLRVPLMTNRWPLVIFDEAHTLRNRKTKTRFDLVRRLLRPDSAVFMLTGTPIFKNAGDLWPLLWIASKRAWPSYWRFVQRFAWVDQDEFGWRVEGVRDAATLRAATAPFMLVRTKEEVMAELPPKTRQRVPLEPARRQGKAYRELERELMTTVGPADDERLLLAPSTLAKVTRLRQLLASPRLLDIDEDGAAMEALAADYEGASKPLVVFTPFAEALPPIHDALAEAGYELIEHLKGGMRPAAITQNLRAFKHYSGPNKALISTVQMGTGWAATDADEVAFVGYDWSPPVNIQAEDRVHRAGQRRPVRVRYYVHRNTIDEHVMDVLSGKLTVARAILSRRAG